MIFNLYKCDGCGGEARTEPKAGVPVGWVQFQFLSAVRIRVSKAIIACSRACARKAIENSVEEMYDAAVAAEVAKGENAGDGPFEEATAPSIGLSSGWPSP